MSSKIAARVGFARTGASASDRSADVTALVLRTMTERAGYAVSSLRKMGDGYGFRKIRRELGVTAFGINALVLPPDYSTGVHYHDLQEETYFVHQGQIEFRFGDGTRHLVGPGGIVRVDPTVHRGLRNAGQSDAILIVAGGRDGYVGRDGQAVGSGVPGAPPGAPSPGAPSPEAA
jgi:mannose-6-phosphate isomerase-like protein (cupin superfamily)